MVSWGRQRIQIHEEGSVFVADDFSIASAESSTQDACKIPFILNALQELEERGFAFSAYDYIYAFGFVEGVFIPEAHMASADHGDGVWMYLFGGFQDSFS